MSPKAILPHYYRSITARVKPLIPSQKSILMFTILFQLLVCVFMGILLYVLYDGYISLKNGRAYEQSNLIKWEKTVLKHPSYPQAYYEAAYYAARTGNLDKSNEYLEKALSLRENYEAAKQLQLEIKK